MKKYLITAFLVVFSICLYAQKPYSYIIIPTQFPEIGKGMNPYAICSSIQKILNDKSIENKYQTEQFPENYCDALILDVHNNSNMFKVKLKIELKDCYNHVIWQSDGSGLSKDYQKGYAEAVADALKNLKEMPEMKGKNIQAEVQNVQTAVIPPDETEQTGTIYRPSDLYYNYTYFTDLVEKDNGTKELVVINGKLLGYNDLENIAILTPSGQSNQYAISWKDANGQKSAGIATLTDQQLKITLSDGGQIKIIVLQKY